MNRVLFVDDETSILSGLRRMLRPYRNEWEMAFAESGEQALIFMEEKPFDVVVSDMKMPGMNGVEFLTKIKNQYPDAIRIALSGHAEMEMLLESVQVTHQFLAKPSDAEHIRNVVAQAFALREMLEDEHLRSCIASIDILPSLPELYSRVMEAASSPDGTLKDIGHIVGEDISMSAKILKIVNSAYFGLAREVSSPEDAATILGLNVIRSLILSAKIFSSFDQSNCALNLEKLNRHCQRVGFLARAIAQHEDQSRRICDLSLMSGLLHDIGKLVLATAYADRFPETLNPGRPSEDWEEEQHIFGISHAQIGAYLLGVWNLPNSVVEAVAYHHIPDKAIEHSFSPLTATHIADALLLEFEAEHEGDTEPAFCVDYVAKFADEEKLNDWRALTVELFGGIN
ncbi:MAG: HDOD domain-containing protein [Pseudomonadales bacterium]|nr:HDOD domain-containing protein [Pseudomonadales bacterium]